MQVKNCGHVVEQVVIRNVETAKGEVVDIYIHLYIFGHINVLTSKANVSVKLFYRHFM